MKELSALDLYYLLTEMQILVNGKIDQVYQQDEDVLIRFHVSGVGKKILRIKKHLLYLTEFKEEQGTPTGLALQLRKLLKNFRIRSLEQMGFERVLRFELEKDVKYNLYIELFGSGNVILVDTEDKIISCRHTSVAGGRAIKRGEQYVFPKREFDLLTAKLADFKNILKESDESLVKTLARGCGIGGRYSEEVLLSWDKNAIANTLNAKDSQRLFEEVQGLLHRDIVPSRVKSLLLPIEVDSSEPLGVDTYNEALDTFLTQILLEEQVKQQMSAYNREKDKIDAIISSQQKTVNRLEKMILDNSSKGELIYANYADVEKLVKTIPKLVGQDDWEEKKKKILENPKIAKIDEKNGMVVVDLE